jgi:hypothetical protein
MLSVRKLVFAGALLAVVPFAAVAQEKAAPKTMPPGTTVVPGPAPTVVPGPAPVYPAPGVPYGASGTPCPPAPCPPAPCPPQTMKVCKMVPTQVQETRTVMKQVQRQECYTAYRTETVREKKCVPCTTYQTITETVMENRTRCIKVPCVEQKTVMEKRKKIEWVTETKEKCHISFKKDCVSLGGHNCCGNGGGFGGGHGCCGHGGGDGCGDGCGHSCFNFSFPICKPTIERECVQVCRPKCTYECVPVCKTVCTYKTQTVTECVPVCKKRCVPVTTQKEVEVCRQVCVPYQATRCVTECVPTQECVTVCKMVPTWVEVPCPAPAPCPQPCPTAAAPCGPSAAPCGNPCDSGYGHGNGGGCCLFDKLNCFSCNLHDKWGNFCHGMDCLKCDIGNKWGNFCHGLDCFKCDIGNKFSGCFGGGCCK